MNVTVTATAERQIAATVDTILRTSGRQSMLKFRQCLRHNIHLLRLHPHLGPREDLLLHREVQYRSLVISPLNKLVYTIADDTIEIVALWDTRREPSTLSNDVT